jgi:hypothetical protein
LFFFVVLLATWATNNAQMHKSCSRLIDLLNKI